MAGKIKYGIATSVIAVTIATAGITTVTSFAFAPEAQALSIKKPFKKAYKKTRRVVEKKAKAKIAEVKNHIDTVRGLPRTFKYGASSIARDTKNASKSAVSRTRRAGSHVRKAVGSYRRCLTIGCGQIGNLPRGTNSHDHRS